MWQTHYVLYRARMDALLAEADRQRRWRHEDEANGRAPRRPVPGPARQATARLLASLSRRSARMAHRLDGRIGVELRQERWLGDA